MDKEDEEKESFDEDADIAQDDEELKRLNEAT